MERKNGVTPGPANGKIKADILIIGISACLYFFNQQVRGSIETRWLYLLMNGYFNDAVCGMAFGAYCDILITLWRRPRIRRGQVRPWNRLERLAVTEAILLGCGLIWEVVVPCVLPDSVGDGWDIVAYLVGGMVYWTSSEATILTLYRIKNRQ